MSIYMNSASVPDIVAPLLNRVFDGVMNQADNEQSQVFDEIKGLERSYHSEPVLSGLGAAPELPEGMPVTYQNGGELYNANYWYKVYGLAFAITKVMEEDSDHIRLGQIYAKQLGQALIETKETLGANILNNSFSNSYTMLPGDGVSLVNSSHPIQTGSFSNLLTAAALSQTSLEQAVISVMQAVDNNGKKIALNCTKLIVSPPNALQADVLLGNALRSGTANNDLNPVKAYFRDTKPVVLRRLTSNTAWWVQTSADRGLQLVMRRKVQRSMEGDFETDTMRYKATERYVFGWTNPRAVWGNAGL